MIALRDTVARGLWMGMQITEWTCMVGSRHGSVGMGNAAL